MCHSLSLQMTPFDRKILLKSFVSVFVFVYFLFLFLSAIFAAFCLFLTILSKPFRVSKAGNVSSVKGHCPDFRLELYKV